ncbi:MAG: hypothetical protein GX166_10990 [Clostridiaceae bacterium]|nr:hypothetical protein [Clostridiaceae bacterium]
MKINAFKDRRKKVRELAERRLIPWKYMVLPIFGKIRNLELVFIELENSRIV